MKKENIPILQKSFEDCAQTVDEIEFWHARNLQKLVYYDEWRNFLKVIEKAKISCKKAGQRIEDHFVGINKTIAMPEGASKELKKMLELGVIEPKGEGKAVYYIAKTG